MSLFLFKVPRYLVILLRILLLGWSVFFYVQKRSPIHTELPSLSSARFDEIYLSEGRVQDPVPIFLRRSFFFDTTNSPQPKVLSYSLFVISTPVSLPTVRRTHPHSDIWFERGAAPILPLQTLQGDSLFQAGLSHSIVYI